ncbi:MAG: hypothetical protein DSO07_06100 [Thermoproteota archaeon]|jgi:nucleoside diphosphate kinase|uniref:nucleoside-diphosphate kinase n=1 Tax=Candidatus Methanodesulfokora washburnensis TaxID=2478471 RepID=A0A520KHI0_9CREN|nr:MAG: hypothetical protein EF810_07760 [Candidatus Methanodesulfokores washburnensis]TDA41195.1 MAG: hypothetical protein DSO07_06100 [Candidatus Korarchaeota archaeon]
MKMEEGYSRDPLSFFYREDQLENEVYSKLKEMLEAEADPGQIKMLPKISFAMIKPDAYLRGLAPTVISRLEEEGFHVAKFDVRKMKSREIDELYMFVKNKYRESWWIMPKVFSMAPVVPMILTGDTMGFDHLSERLRELIGPTTPDAGRPGGMRYDLKGANRVLNIIHASDDPASALREALVFFSLEEILDVLSGGFEPLDVESREFTPEEPMDLRRWRVFNEIKLEAADLLEQGRQDILSLLDKEAEIVEMDLPVDEERESLMEIERAISAKAEKIRREILNSAVVEARSPADIGRKISFSERMEESLVSLRIIELLSDEEKLSRYKNFDFLLLKGISAGIITENYQEVVAHSTWAVAPQMIADLKKVGKKPITILEATK